MNEYKLSEQKTNELNDEINRLNVKILNYEQEHKNTNEE